MDDSDKLPETPRVCEACGGVDKANCHWCTDGLQVAEQRIKWKAFRMRMRAMSGTYALFQSLIEEVTERLEQNNTEIARELASSGRMFLSKWMESDPDSQEREEASKELLRFHRRAVALLSR
jgi:hypothetical protein